MENKTLLRMLCIIILGAFLSKKIDCATTTASVPMVYNSDAVLTCTGITNPKYYVNSVAIAGDSSKYTLGANSATLTIKKLKKSDIQSTYYCSDTSSNQVNFNLQVSPYFYQVDTFTIISIEGNTAELTCYLIVGTESSPAAPVTFAWELNSQTLATGGRYEITSTTTTTKLKILNLETSDKGYYYCKATNTYGTASRVTRLRVKSKIAPVYPFIGVVIEVIILLSVSLIQEFYWKPRKDGTNTEKKSITSNNIIQTDEKIETIQKEKVLNTLQSVDLPDEN